MAVLLGQLFSSQIWLISNLGFVRPKILATLLHAKESLQKEQRHLILISSPLRTMGNSINVQGFNAIRPTI